MSKDEQKGEAWAGAGQGEAFSSQANMAGQGYGQQNPPGQANMMGQPQPMGQYGYQPQYQPQFAPQYQYMGQPGLNQPQAEAPSQPQGQPQYQYMGQPQFMAQPNMMGQGFQPQYVCPGVPPQFQTQGQFMGQPGMMGQPVTGQPVTGQTFMGQPQAGQAYSGQAFAGQSSVGQADGHDDHEKLHDKNQYGQQNGPDMGQMYGMMQDVIKGDADASKIMSFLQASGGDFWKGALVGAAAVLLLTNGAVKDALAGVMGSMFGQQGADETGAGHAPETGEA